MDPSFCVVSRLNVFTTPRKSASMHIFITQSTDSLQKKKCICFCKRKYIQQMQMNFVIIHLSIKIKKVD